MRSQLAAIAASNGGPFTRRQALAVGHSPKSIRHNLQIGRWLTLHAGIYIERGVLRDCEGDPARRHAVDVAATMLALRTVGTAGSHHSAALLHGLAMLRGSPSGVTVTSPPERKSRSAPTGVRLYYAALPDAHLCRRYGIMATSPARAVVDLARTMTYQEAVVVADAALRQRQTHHAELADILRYCRRWPGARRATRVVGFADDGAESILESLARLLFETYGLPAPRTQVLVGDTWSPIGRVDFYWPDYGVVGEADGMLKYDQPHALRVEKLRQERLEEAGYEVVRFTWNDVVHHPEQTARRVRSALDRGATKRARSS